MSKIPDTWGMPDDLGKKITEGLNRKTLRPEDELADALEEMARDIALIEPGTPKFSQFIRFIN